VIQTLVSRGKQYLLNDPVYRRVVSNSSWLLSASTLTTVLISVQGIIMARALGAEQYGILALITGYTTYVNHFVDSRVWEAAIKFVIQYRETGELAKATATVKLCYLVDAVTGSAGFVILLLTAEWAGRTFVKDPFAAGFIRFYALSMLIAIPIGTSSALLRIQDRFDWLAYQEAGVAVLRLAGVIVVLILGGRIMGLLAVYMLAAFSGMLTLLVLSRKVTPSLGLLAWTEAPLSSLRGEFKQIAHFLFTTNAAALSKLVRNTDTLLIGYWLTPTDVGYFRVARSITSLMNFPVGPLQTASYPEFARLWHQQRRTTLQRLLRKLVLFATIVASVALMVIWLGGDWLIRITVGEQYLPALPVMRWLALAMAIAVATNFGHSLLLAIGRASGLLLAITLGSIGQLILLLMLLPAVGLSAAGIGHLGYYLIWTVVVAIVAARAMSRDPSPQVSITHP
jgi:O-antigen/teichoic acid export membrane protein